MYANLFSASARDLFQIVSAYSQLKNYNQNAAGLQEASGEPLTEGASGTGLVIIQFLIQIPNEFLEVSIDILFLSLERKIHCKKKRKVIL